MNGSTAPQCPSHFALDDRELHGGGPPGVGDHVQGCRSCQARLAERSLDRTGYQDQAGALWTRIAAEAQQRRRRHRRWRPARLRLAALVVGIGAVALWAAVREPARQASYVGPKGRAPLQIICRRGESVFALAPGADVAPGDQLRFRPLPVWPEARFIQIGSVDGTGRYTPFYPSTAGAPSVPLPADGVALDGSIRLDAAPGPERLFVVLSKERVSEATVARTAEAQVASSATVDQLDGVPVSTAWIVLPKRTPPPAAP